MNRRQHETQRQLEAAEREWLEARYWRWDGHGWQHDRAAKMVFGYTQRDAIMVTRAEPLKYGAPR